MVRHGFLLAWLLTELWMINRPSWDTVVCHGDTGEEAPSTHTLLGEEPLTTPQSMAYSWRKARSALEVTWLTSAAGFCPLRPQCPEPCY